MYYFCTLFDSNYLSRGLAMYESLKKTTPAFHLYIFAFDEKCRSVLAELKLEYVTVISLTEFENEKLLDVKKDRTRAEYCWTSTSSSISYCLKTYKIDHCTYVDADLYYFSSPSVLVDELKDNSVSVISHRYSPQYKYFEANGIYCVQFMTFKNDENGLKVLEWWTQACMDWCYARNEDGKYGDQKYLDDWLVRFKGVCELGNIGAGVAPWNVQQYAINNKNGILEIHETGSGKKEKLIFYHFHNFRFMENNMFELGTYFLTNEVIMNIYRPYLLHLEQIAAKIAEIDSHLNPHGMYKPVFYWKTVFTYLKRKYLGTYNIISRNKLIQEDL